MEPLDRRALGDGGDIELRTERLLLRRWRDPDREPFAALNADPVVMEHFPSTLTRAQSNAMVDRIIERFPTAPGEVFGPVLWAVEVPGERAFIGFVGLASPTFAAPFTPCVEVGWRLEHRAWGRGYATEAARAAIADGFDAP